MEPFVVRRAAVGDVPAMARVHVRSWQETFRGLMGDDVLDDPGLVAVRERFWSAALTDERHAARSAAVAERGGTLVGVAMSGPARDDDAGGAVQLFVLYLLAEHHGSGAGSALLDAVLEPGQPAVLWVADRGPRAQALYRKHGFRADGARALDGDTPVIRMTRAAGGG